MKKVLIALLIIILAAGGTTGTLYFYNQNKNQIQQNAQLASQNAQIQQQLSAIGAMTTVYEVSRKVYSGKPIQETDLISVSIPVSALGTTSITDMSQLIGRCYKVDIMPGTILSTDMLMADDNDEDGTDKFTRELTFTSLPVTTKVGDYVDIRMMLPNGEEYTVLTHMLIQRLYNTTLTFYVSEEENAIINSMLADFGQYSGVCTFYLMKYLNPGSDDSVAFYPVNYDVENFIKFNVNITDTTRCINPTLRDHIDEVLLLYSDSKNQSAASAFISTLNTQLSSQMSAQQDWIQANTDEDGNFTVTGDGISQVEGGDSSISQDFNNQVNDAIDSIDESIEDMEAIQ